MLFRIAKALKESENYTQGNRRQGNSGRNRRTVVRMQSKLAIPILFYVLNLGTVTLGLDTTSSCIHFLFSGCDSLFSDLLDTLSRPTNDVCDFDTHR